MNIKKISKYTLNILTIINALLLGINSVEGITIPYVAQISGVITAVMGVISTYLLSGKIIGSENISTELTDRQLKKIYGEIPVEPDEIETAPITHEEGEINE